MCRISMKVDSNTKLKCVSNTIRLGEIDKLLCADSVGLKLPADREQGDDMMNKKGNESKRGQDKKKVTNGRIEREESWGVPDR